MKNSVLIVSTICTFIYGCGIAQNRTPEKYQYISIVNEGIYQKNKIALVDSIHVMIKRNIDPYNSVENDLETKIFVDSILYSPQGDKIAFFVLTGNSNDKLIHKGNKSEFHYDAHCFIGHINKDYQLLDMTWLRGHNLSNYQSLKDASNRIREVYFKELILRRNSKGESTYKYNLDDVRFWNGPLWDKYFG
jgi:hypothetical protein